MKDFRAFTSLVLDLLLGTAIDPSLAQQTFTKEKQFGSSLDLPPAAATTPIPEPSPAIWENISPAIPCWS